MQQTRTGSRPILSATRGPNQRPSRPWVAAGLFESGYNRGENAVRRALKRLDDPFSDRSYWKLVEVLAGADY